MAKLRFPVLILAILIAAVLCACGDTTAASSAPEGIETFGFEINPSAQPSVGQTVPGVDNPPSQVSQQPPANSFGIVIEGDTPTSIQPSASPTATQTSPTSRPTSSPGGNGGNGGGNGGGNQQNPYPDGGAGNELKTAAIILLVLVRLVKTPKVGDTSPSPSGDTPVSPGPSGSDEPVTSPSISPPAPVSSATIEEATAYVGKPLSQLIAALGYPYSSDYEDVVEGDPNTDRIGTLYFNGYVVTTLRTEDGETVTAVVPN